MAIQLDELVKDRNLAWDASTFGAYILSEDVLSELRRNNLPKNFHEVVPALENFPRLGEAINYFNRSYLKEGLGFGTIKGLSPKEFSKDQQRIIYWMMCNFLGDPLVQNAQGDLVYEVRDRGKTMEAGGRYSETSQGGVLHTDSVQWDHPPDILGLLCLHPAMSGGESVVVSAHSIHN